MKILVQSLLLDNMESICWLTIIVGFALGFLFFKKKSPIRGEVIVKAGRDVDKQKELNVQPNKYFKMDKRSRQDILNANQMLKTDPTKAKKSSMDKICKENSLSLDERNKLVTEVREALKRLETSGFSAKEYQKTIDNAEDLLFAIYEAGSSRVSFTLEEQKEFWPLVQKALPAIGSRIRYIVSDFPPGSLQSSKIERSGLQFLLDNIKDFPTSNNEEKTVIVQILSDFRAEEDVDEWDVCLKRTVFDDLDPGVGVPQPSTPDVPSTHWWFFHEEDTSTVNNKCDDPDEVHWKTEAKELQQYFYNHLGDREWDQIEKREWTFFRQKVGYGIYGPPSKEPTIENKFTGYEDNQLELIEKICIKLHKINEDISQEYIMFSCIFIIGKILNDNFTIPVFRTRKITNGSSTYFVDTNCQVYSSWGDYLKHNTLPKCTYCYPHDGHYIADDSGNVIIGFGTSPAYDKFHEKYISVSNNNSSYPYAADLSDCEPSTFDCSLLAAQTRLLSTIPTYPRASEVIGLAIRIALAVGNNQCLSVSGILIIPGMAVLVDKRKQNELKELGVFQFTTSCLFFTNAAIDLKTCLTIIEDVQQDFQQDLIGEQSNVWIPIARKLYSSLCGPRKWHRPTHRIKTVKQINGKAELYEIMVHPDLDNQKVKLYQDIFKELRIVSRDSKLSVYQNKNLELHTTTKIENRF